MRGGAVSGSAFTTQPVITLRDAFGNALTNSTASVTMTVSGNGTTVGTTTVNAVAGVATFSGVGISGTAGTPYTLTFVSDGLTSATQSSLTIVSVAPGHSLGASGYLPGGQITVTNTLTHTNAAGALKWSVLLPSGWNLKGATGDEGALRPTGGTTELLEWTWATVPVSPFTFDYVLNTPEGSAGEKQLSALVTLGSGETAVQITAKPDPLIVPQLTTHSADVDRNMRISLMELTRVIELYNTRTGTTRTGAYKLQTGTEDGFAPSP